MLLNGVITIFYFVAMAILVFIHYRLIVEETILHILKSWENDTYKVEKHWDHENLRVLLKISFQVNLSWVTLFTAHNGKIIGRVHWDEREPISNTLVPIGRLKNELTSITEQIALLYKLENNVIANDFVLKADRIDKGSNEQNILNKIFVLTKTMTGCTFRHK